MTDDLRVLVDDYRQGLEAEVSLLETLVRLAARQADASAAGDVDALSLACTEREHIVEDLLALERRLRPRREALSHQLEAALACEPLDAVKGLHLAAARRIDEVLAHDQRTRRHLELAEHGRREAAQTLETGGATLAAYRKVLSHTSPASSIVDQRG